MPETSDVRVQQCPSINQEWLRLRRELWPDHSADSHTEEMAELCANPDRFAQFIAYDESGSATGLAEASVRSDYVNGATSSPVAFLEGLYVVPAARRRGVARALVESVERWARSVGCRELASDARLENEPSHAMHLSLGFRESERVVFFQKELS